mmetsp:Transcript_156749/g.278097  ORF Transcript_156749/g.278097 Transcript_156749/m.278097 type:complete len:87 (-) Transcript_156749:1576-1836(-)
MDTTCSRWFGILQDSPGIHRDIQRPKSVRFHSNSLKLGKHIANNAGPKTVVLYCRFYCTTGCEKELMHCNACALAQSTLPASLLPL